MDKIALLGMIGGWESQRYAVKSAFARPLYDIEYAAVVAYDSPIRKIGFRHDHILFRPYSPRGTTAGGLWLERHPDHPKIWGWVLAISATALQQYADLSPGTQVIVGRSQGEPIAKEQPSRSLYLGHHHPVIALPLAAIQGAIRPPLVRMDGPSHAS